MATPVNLPLEQLVDLTRRHLESRKLCILTGAGVSMLPPTRLPSGNELRDMAVRALGSVEHADDVDRLLNTSAFDVLLPELVFQRIWEYLDTDLAHFLEVLRPAHPNNVHCLLASLAVKSGLSIATTNFDLLIEESTKATPSVLHLHGSLDHADSLVMRLNQVGRPMAASTAKRFLEMIEHTTLLILGYSGRDRDVMALIRRAEVRQVLWLAYTEQDYALQAASRTEAPTYLAVGDLQDFGGLLRHQANVHFLPQKEEQAVQMPISAARRRLAEDWATSLSEAKRTLALAGCHLEANEFAPAANLALHAAATEPKNISVVTSSAGILRLTANFAEGIDLIEGALDLPECEPLAQAQAFNVAGLLYLEKREPEPKKALPYFHKALRRLNLEHNPPLLKEERRLQLAGRVYNNLGLTLDDLDRLDESSDAFEESLAIKRRLGDLLGTAQSAANLSLTLYKQRNYNRAGYWRRKALAYADRYELDFLRAYLLRRYGVAQCEQGQPRRGIQTLKDAAKCLDGVPGARFDRELIQRALDRYSACT